MSMHQHRARELSVRETSYVVGFNREPIAIMMAARSVAG